MPSIFLSHSWEDKFFARKLAEKLAEFGVDVWIDEAELKVGDSLIQKISEAIEKTEYVAVVLSHNSVASPWVQKELSIAMTQEIAGKKVKVLPILLEKCEIPEFLKDKLYADFTDLDKFDESLSKILYAIGVSKTKAFVPKKPPKVEREPAKPIPALEDFEDLKITGVDKNRLYRPDPNKLLYNVYLRLSSRPPIEWVQIFEEERRFPRHSMWRRAWVDGQYIIVHCCLDELEMHLKDIKQDVTNTNRKYREYLRRLAVEREKKLLRAKKEQEEIDKALEGLDFE